MLDGPVATPLRVAQTEPIFRSVVLAAAPITAARLP